MTTSFYHGLNFKTKTINQNFRIKVSGFDEGTKLHKLVGVSGLIDLIGDIELVNKLFDRAFNSKDYRIICKLRRGVVVTFYSK